MKHLPFHFQRFVAQAIVDRSSKTTTEGHKVAEKIIDGKSSVELSKSDSTLFKFEYSQEILVGVNKLMGEI